MNDEKDYQTAIGADAAESYRPRLSYYHPNGRGTGGAVQFELHPAHGSTDGSIFATFARQKTVGTHEGGVRTFPRFDWSNRICVKLDMSDLMQILQVFRGIQESIADGKGLFHRSASACTVVRLEHRIEPQPGYVFEACRKPLEGEPSRAGVVFTAAEALGLSLAIEQSMDVIAFGLPMLIPRGVQRQAVVSRPQVAHETEPGCDIPADDPDLF
ncbi:MAG: hypothetical protein IKO72_09930 [Kiritimatiellae bacterium]|nr:hypothetical protein [Kiritimatiellia bacterium]